MATAIDRKTAIARTLSAAFGALDDFKAKNHDDGLELYAWIVAHCRSACPQALLSVDTGPVPVIEVESPALVAEIDKLKLEVETMRNHLNRAARIALQWIDLGIPDEQAFGAQYDIGVLLGYECSCAEDAADPECELHLAVERLAAEADHG